MRLWAFAAAVAAACASTAAPPRGSADFDTTTGSGPAVVASGPTTHTVTAEEGDAGPARKPPVRDVLLLPVADPVPRDTAPDQQIMTPGAWRRCAIDADCAVVAAPCTAERVIAVNRKFTAALEDGVRHACGANAITDQVPRCAGGRCVATSPEPPPLDPAR